jgi:hypothetical protein
MDAEQVSGAINNWKLHVDRDLRKAYAAFHFAAAAGETEVGPIATGNWGCGGSAPHRIITSRAYILAHARNVQRSAVTSRSRYCSR